MSGSALTQALTATADDDRSGIDSPDPIDPGNPGGGGGGDGSFRELWTFSDEVTDEYGGSAEGYSSLTVAQMHADPVTNYPWHAVSIEIGGHAITHTNSGDFLDNVEHTSHAISWDNDAAEGNPSGLVQSGNNSATIGGYHETYDQTDSSVDPASIVLEQGLGMLGADVILTGTEAILQGICALFDYVYDYPETIQRQWDWGGKIQPSWWAKYRVYLEPGESLTIDVGDQVDLYGGQTPLYTGGSFEIFMPYTVNTFRERINSRVSSSQLRRAGLRGISFPDIHEGLVAYSGSVVKENPVEFGVEAAQISALDDEDVYYQFPVEMSLLEPLSEDFWSGN